MEWLKPFLPIIETGFKVFATRRFLKTSSDNAKGIALRSSIIAFGAIAFFVFLVAAVIMVAVDLGHQLEAQNGIHFSGMMLSATLLLAFALTFLGFCFFAAKHLAAKETRKKESAKDSADPYASLILFGEEFLKQLTANLNEKPAPPVNTPTNPS